ncbi:hypothetical protein ACFPIJ_00445 [Dactylosporangium cerinum]|uniref:ATP-grasp target RiPP n=1 Tax=Dactylosporangium cerinum TaxID=1434730 RepID=A0ABV9VIR6_9ACTN
MAFSTQAKLLERVEQGDGAYDTPAVFTESGAVTDVRGDATGTDE